MLLLVDVEHTSVLEQPPAGVGQAGGEPGEVATGVEVQLVVEADRGLDRKGQLRGLGQGGRKAQPSRGQELRLDRGTPARLARPHVRRCPGQVAVDAELVDQTGHLVQGGLVGLGVLPGLLLTVPPDEGVVEEAVL